MDLLRTNIFFQYLVVNFFNFSNELVLPDPDHQ